MDGGSRGGGSIYRIKKDQLRGGRKLIGGEGGKGGSRYNRIEWAQDKELKKKTLI